MHQVFVLFSHSSDMDSSGSESVISESSNVSSRSNSRLGDSNVMSHGRTHNRRKRRVCFLINHIECDVMWCDVMCCVVLWCGGCVVVWCGVVWFGLMWCGGCGVMWCSVVWCGVVGVVWCGVICCVVLCCDMLWIVELFRWVDKVNSHHSKNQFVSQKSVRRTSKKMK